MVCKYCMTDCIIFMVILMTLLGFETVSHFFNAICY